MSISNEETASLSLVKGLIALLIEKDVLSTEEIKRVIDHDIWLRAGDEDQGVSAILTDCRNTIDQAFSRD